MQFDSKKFFDGYRTEFGSLSTQQVNGLNNLLDCVENDPYLKDVRHVSYIFATVKHETADTYHPIHEYGSRTYFIKRYGGQTRKGRELGNDTAEEGYFYAGKGYPQVTGESNYEKAEDAIRREYPKLVADFEKRTGRQFDLTVGDQPGDDQDPQNMLDPVISYATMSYGMRTGMFTGKKLADFIKGDRCDYVGARHIINGNDRAPMIAEYAHKFEKIFRDSKVSAVAPAESLPAESDLNKNRADESQDSPVKPSNIEQPSITSETIRSESNPSTGESALEKSTTSFTPETITQYVPKIVGAKRWFGTLSIGGVASTVWAVFNGLPAWQVFVLGMITAVVVIGFAWILIHYKLRVFELVKAVLDINADPTKNNIALTAEKK